MGKFIKGSIYFTNGKLRYTGNFDENEHFSDNGTLYFNNEPNSIKYQGDF